MHGALSLLLALGLRDRRDRLALLDICRVRMALLDIAARNGHRRAGLRMRITKKDHRIRRAARNGHRCAARNGHRCVGLQITWKDHRIRHDSVGLKPHLAFPLQGCGLEPVPMKVLVCSDVGHNFTRAKCWLAGVDGVRSVGLCLGGDPMPIMTFVQPQAVVRIVRRRSTALVNYAAVHLFLGGLVLVSVLIFAHLEDKSHGALCGSGQKSGSHKQL